MTQPHVQFLFDFGSPNAYLVHKVLPDVVERTGVPFHYVPILLGGVFKATGNVSPAVAFANVRNKPEYQALETKRFIARHDLDAFRFNPHFPVNTLFLMRGAVFAQSQGNGLFERYVDEVFRHMWEEPKAMDDPEVIARALESSGFSAADFAQGTQIPRIKQLLIDNTAEAVEAGVFGAPSFLVGSELYFGKDRLREVEEEIRVQSESP